MADRYREAGVDIDKAARIIDNISPLVRSTHTSAVISDLKGFSGLVALNVEAYHQPVLVSSTDGVGTKLKIAFMSGKHDTVGIDLVAMCVNDIVVTGAKPLFMLDYLATGKLEEGVVEQIIKGIVEGCKKAKCALIGGETAEMPGFYAPGEYDLAGFVVGVVERQKIIDGSSIGKHAALVGLASSGLHSNGYSLVRKVFFEELKLGVEEYVEALGRTVAEELLEPTLIYSEAVLNIARDFELLGAAHITGGGILENIPRVLPESLKAVIHLGSWEVPAIFSFLEEAAGLSRQEMFRTFNCGVGMVLVVPQSQASDVVERLEALGQNSWIIGEVAPREEGEEAVELVE